MAENKRKGLNLTPPPKRQFQEGGLAESKPMRPEPRPRLDLTREDILAIERMVWAEGRGESPEGRDAIRSVILNRIASDRFDGNVKDVLERSDTRVDSRGREVTTYQFQPIGVYGSVDNIPAPEPDLDQQYFEFLDFIERGEDASGGRSFFQNTEKAEDRYVGVDPLVIGNHTFYKGLEGQEPVRDINFSHNVRLVGDDVGMAEGGMAMDEEMSSILKEEGGLTDDGMDRDPVSGNEVPPGSMANEVRDDIDVRLSDGEYVVPADVVRYYGVKFFEDLRGEAKMGLNQMERTGRIGGEPISPEQIARVDGMGMAQGGLVPASNFQQKIPSSAPQLMEQPVGMAPGGLMSNSASYLRDDGSIDYDKLVGESSRNMYLQTPYRSLADLFADFSQVGSYTQRMREGRPAPVTEPTPTFDSSQIEYRTYIGPNGQIMMIPFINGEAQIEIPEGFTPQGSTEAQTAAQAPVRDGGDDSGFTTTTGVTTGQTSSQDRISNIDRALEDVDFENPVQAGINALEGNRATGTIAGGILGALVAGPAGASLGRRLGEATQQGGQLAEAAVNSEVAKILGYDTTELDNAINTGLSGMGRLSKDFATNAVNRAREEARNALFNVDSPFALTRDKFQSDEAFTAAMESVAPEGMTYSEDSGSYTRDDDVSAAPTTSLRPGMRPDRDNDSGSSSSSSSSSSRSEGLFGDRDGDGVPNMFDRDDGVGLFDRSRGAAEGGLMAKSTTRKRTRKTKK